ncbi:hypothetical protein F4777DRAFT_526651 [Nemania sp. FL0916]|nr:hypothetical protein F4777DRAFT_526651 [Nemania sp. FL0916]
MMNNMYYNISQEGSEMTESPIIPPSMAQTYSRSQPPTAKFREPDLDKWKSRVPNTESSRLVPKPLFTSEKCVVEIESGSVASGETISTASNGPTPGSGVLLGHIAPATMNITPISPSPSLFPIPPSTDAIVSSPVSMDSPVMLHPSNSVVSRSSAYSQSKNAAAARPRPVSSIYSQNTLTTVSAVSASSPRTPIITEWVSSLPGLPRFDEPDAEMQASVNALPPTHLPTYMEQVPEEPPTPHYIQAQIQVPRLRSPSLPQDRINRRRTVSGPVSASSQETDRSGVNGSPFIPSPDSVIYPQINAVPMNYEGHDWPLQKPSVVHDMPQKHAVRRSEGSNVLKFQPSYHVHVANKASISSSITQTTPGIIPEHPNAEATTPRPSVDSRTPIYGPGEQQQQQSGWWSDDDEDAAEQGRGSNIARYAAKGKKRVTMTMAMTKTAAKANAQRLRARKIKIAVGASVVVVLVVVGIAVGVTFGTRH